MLKTSCFVHNQDECHDGDDVNVDVDEVNIDGDDVDVDVDEGCDLG